MLLSDWSSDVCSSDLALTNAVGENNVNTEATGLNTAAGALTYSGSEPIGTVSRTTVFGDRQAIMGESGVETVVPLNNSPAAKAAFEQAAAFHQPKLSLPEKMGGHIGDKPKFARGGLFDRDTGKRVSIDDLKAKYSHLGSVVSSIKTSGAKVNADIKKRFEELTNSTSIDSAADALRQAFFPPN